MRSMSAEVWRPLPTERWGGCVSKHFGVFIKQIYKYTLYIFYIRKWKLYVTNTFERREGSSRIKGVNTPGPLLQFPGSDSGGTKPGENKPETRTKIRVPPGLAALATRITTTVLPYRLLLSLTPVVLRIAFKMPPLRTLSTCLTLLTQPHHTIVDLFLFPSLLPLSEIQLPPEEGLDPHLFNYHHWGTSPSSRVELLVTQQDTDHWENTCFWYDPIRLLTWGKVILTGVTHKHAAPTEAEFPSKIWTLSLVLLLQKKKNQDIIC